MICTLSIQTKPSTERCRVCKFFGFAFSQEICDSNIFEKLSVRLAWLLLITVRFQYCIGLMLSWMLFSFPDGHFKRGGSPKQQRRSNHVGCPVFFFYGSSIWGSPGFISLGLCQLAFGTQKPYYGNSGSKQSECGNGEHQRIAVFGGSSKKPENYF